MTSLVLLPREKARDVLIQALGADAAQTAGIADLVREEVTARGSCARAMTIKRVCRFVAPAIALESSTVSDVCDLLEREGDVVLGDAGLLFSTPLRAIDLGEGMFRVASSMSTRRLASFLVGSWNVVGTSRTCLVQNPVEAHAAVGAAGGVVLTPAAWASLDRVPCADERWLDGLDRRLKVQSEAAASLERDEPLGWAGLAVTPAGFRWKVDGRDPSTRLWRAKNRWGHWHYAWTEHDTPHSSPFVSLHPDDGARTAFAIARRLGVSPEATMTKHEQIAMLAISHWLPRAEYRFLAVSATPVATERNTIRWTMPLDRLAHVLEVLHQRIGLVLREESTR